jgi:Sulfotransferase family
MATETRPGRTFSRRRRVSSDNDPAASYPAPAEPIETAIKWASWGPLSRGIARVLRPRQPAVLVLSLPRSGSSWVGDMLGAASNALYLREPFTQTDLAVNVRQVFNPPDYPPLEATMRRLADKAFLGLPDFRPKVVVAPEQWDLRHRRRGRVVIKEVNPRACRWFVENYRPRVVFLLRHPAALAWSSVRMQWLGPTPADWEQRGREDRETLRQMWAPLKNYANHLRVYYEDLCNDPLRGFQQLYEFAGLTWTDAVARTVAENGAESPQKVNAWRTDASAEHLRALRRGFDGSDPDWSRWDDDWGLEELR